jgi:hypothetical protein
MNDCPICSKAQKIPQIMTTFYVKAKECSTLTQYNGQHKDKISITKILFQKQLLESDNKFKILEHVSSTRFIK